jgi:(1->4)-alpha-D-glucan 1-alpha-D-glucosylmutase
MSKRTTLGRLLPELLEHYADGRIKLWLTHAALTLRRQHAELFARGDYAPLETDTHAVAFSRVLDEQQVICVVPRLSLRLTDEHTFPLGAVWQGRSVRGITPGRYTDVLCGVTHVLDRSLDLSRAFVHLPLCLLVKEAA